MKIIIVVLVLVCIHFYLISRKQRKIIRGLKSSDEINRLKGYFEMTSRWVKNLQDDVSVVDYLKEKNIQTIAIYGMGNLGELLEKEIIGSDITIQYAIDKNAEIYKYASKDFLIIEPEDITKQEKVDAIIVTPVFAYNKICENLEKYNLSIPIISLDNIIFKD